jgi:hypothetical protein
MIKSFSGVAQAEESTNAPPLAASVFAVTDVGTPVTEAVIDSPAASPGVAVSLLVTSKRISAPVVALVPPTTVTDVAPLGPTDATRPVETALAVYVTEDRRPKPNAATVTSAMRLKVVFVDICFLSISRTEEFPQFGLNQISLIRFDESHVLIHQIPHRVSGRGEETYLFVYHLYRLR